MVNYQILLCEEFYIEEKKILGDFNGDGKITTEDVTKLQRYLNNSSEEIDESIADINLDGIIDELDVRLLLKISAGAEFIRYKTILSDKVICEIGSSTSDFSGKAINPSFYTKIDGTHELTFSLPSHYLNEETGEIVSNDLVKYITNKSKIRLIKNPGNQQEIFHLVVNSKIDKDIDGILTYEYACTDTFIEELSKTGYSLSFGEEVGQNGLGTIHELALEVLKDTGWKYMKEKTGTLYEYSTELQYDIEQQRYNTVYIPKPVHPVKFIPELNRYCNILEQKQTVITKDNEEIIRNIYCYEDTEQIVSSIEKNLIYNSKDFIDLAGWDNFRRTGNKPGEYKYEEGLIVIPYIKEAESENESDRYYMKISTLDSRRRVYLLNSTAAAANTSITAFQPYLLKIDKTKTTSTGKIQSIEIYNKNPRLNTDAERLYQLTKTDLSDGRYYTIVTNTDISSPYIVFNVLLDEVENTRMYIKQFSLFKAIGKSTIEQKDGVEITVSAEENNLTLATELTDGTVLNTTDKRYLPLINLPLDLLSDAEKSSAVSAYTLSKVRYFTRNNYKIENDEEIKINNYAEDTVTYIPVSSLEFPKENVKLVAELPENDISTNIIYHLSSDDKYYQYYQIDNYPGEWGLAFLGNGQNDKIRTLKAEKTNRFNLLQEISELFKAWCVFNIQDLGDGTFERQVWFKEKAINENFAGFHKGVNLKSLERKSESTEVVTKIFVEDIENEFAEDGFVTIRHAKTNPWGENYYYNFKYYIDQNLCATDSQGVPYIEQDLQNLYRGVAPKNREILELNERIANSAGKLAELLRNIKSLSYEIAAADSRIAAINGEKSKKKLSKKEIDKLEANLKREQTKRTAFFNQQEEIQKSYNKLNRDYTDWNKRLEYLQKEKISLISTFERRYSNFIKEGVWSDSSYIDANAYYYDSQKVSNTSAMPATSWTISVLDGSVIEELEDYQFSVGDMTFLVDNDFFNIEKNAEKNYTFEVLISGIKEFFDSPEKNEIELRNYLTSFEDLFQRITASAQTLNLKEQVYDKAAHFNTKGEIDTNIFQKTLSENALVLANTSDNSYTLDDSGLTFQSLVNPVKKTRIIAEGMFIANSLNSVGEPEWKTGITADGINASVLTAGEINTARVKIYADGQPNQVWDELGITSYQIQKIIENGEEVMEVDTNRFIRFDNFGFYFVNETDNLNWNYDDAGAAWFETMSREKAIQQIYDNADLSITEKGFRLNLSDNQTIVSGDSVYTINTEAVRLGYLGEAEIGDFKYDAYGLYIEGQTSSNIIDNKGNNLFQSETSIRFSTDGNNYIGNWKIEKDWIHNDGSSIGAVSLETNSLTFTGKSDMTGHGSARYGTNNLTIDPKKGAKNMHNISLSTSTGLTIKYNDNDIIKTNNDTFWIKNLEIDENFYLRTGNITLLYTDYSNNDVPYLGLNGALRTAIRPSGAESTEYVMKNGVWEVGDELCHGIICYKKYSSGRTKDMGIAIYDGEGSYDAKLYFIYNGSSKLIASFPK